MLHRAASNAYSWWWASHVRTKQSKWLEQNLQDMEEKVNMTLRIIDNGGDSFAQRAEMYYRKRPEIINFVEESFRAYRALAERYDHLSRELQSANRTIATVFPEQVQYAMDADDDHDENQLPDHQDSNDTPKNVLDSKKIPKVPKIPTTRIRSMSAASRKGLSLRNGASSNAKAVTSVATAASGLMKDEALEEIDSLQKGILALQTEEEFVKSMYEHGYNKFWEIENQITEMHTRVSSLQDEFGIGAVIQDDEARTLMATTALRSCQDTLVKLQEKQEQSAEEARVEQQRIREAHEKFESLRAKFATNEADSKWVESDIAGVAGSEECNVEMLKAKIKEQLDVGSESSLSVTELAEKIDELVRKVVSLETAVSSQTALVKRLGSETDKLQSHVHTLEEDKEMLKEGSANMSKRLKELEDELLRVKNLNQCFKEQNNNLQTHFTEANCSLDHLSGKLQSVKHDDVVVVETSELSEDTQETNTKDETTSDDVELEQKEVEIPVDSKEKIEPEESEKEKSGGKPSLRQLFLRGLEDREKLLLEEYTSVLLDYKDVKKKLSEVESKNRDSIYELAVQIRELKSDIASKENEIKSLKHKFDFPQTMAMAMTTPPGESPFACSTEYKYSNQETPRHDNASVTPYNWSGSGRDLVETAKEKLAEEKQQPVSTIEEKLRSDIDRLLEENLEFWLRFSTSVHQIQKFEASIEDLHLELRKLREHKNNNNSKKTPRESSGSSRQHSIQSDSRPIYRHLREIQTEVSLWFEHNAVLKDELQGRLSALCNIQSDISRVSSAGPRGEKPELSVYQAAKFQGEILNMKQENNKVAEELFVGMHRVRGLKLEVDKTVVRLNEDLGISAKSDPHSAAMNPHRPRIPLRSFLFGVKLKRQRPSLFSFQKHHTDVAPITGPN